MSKRWWAPLTDSLAVALPAILLLAIGFAIAYRFVDPAPPSRFVFAAGSASGAYFRFAKAYQSILARDGVELEILETAGTVENLKHLRSDNDPVQVAFVQGGVGSPAVDDGLTSLASLYFEPVWVFHRLGAQLVELNQLHGRRIAHGQPGSGTLAVATQLLAANGITEENAQLQSIGGDDAVRALLDGQIDVVFLVGAAHSPQIAQLIAAPGVTLLNFQRADAYTRRFRYLSRVTLPRGMLDLAGDYPRADTTLVAPAATLVARETLHPALVDLLMAASEEVHRAGGAFERYGQFPSPEFLDYPLSEEARRFFDSGPSFLRRVLPYWAATLVERLLVLLLPLLALLIPLLRLMPPVYRWRIRSRIYRWYRELLSIDPAVRKESDVAQLQASLSELSRIEREVAQVEVPMSYADQLYHLRLHIELVREKLTSQLRDEP